MIINYSFLSEPTDYAAPLCVSRPWRNLLMQCIPLYRHYTTYRLLKKYKELGLHELGINIRLVQTSRFDGIINKLLVRLFK